MADDTAEYRAACRLLDAIHPGLVKLETTVGVITQIDNAIVHIRNAVRQQAIEDAAERARHFSCCGEDIATAILDPTAVVRKSAKDALEDVRDDLRMLK